MKCESSKNINKNEKRRFYLIGQSFNVELRTLSPLGVCKKLSFQTASPFAFVFKSTCNFSQTFFFGFNCSSGVPVKPSTVKRSPGAQPSGIIKGSTAV